MELSDTQVAMVIGSVLQDVGSSPSGPMYAAMLGRVGIGQYQRVIGKLKAAKLVSEKGHVLTWIGPPKEGQATATAGAGVP